MHKIKSKQGFNIIELIVVMAISAALLAAIGLPAYFSQRNLLAVEQAGQELVGDIRLLKSKILAVQKVGPSAGQFVPKAAYIEMEEGSGNVRVRYVRGNTCSLDSYVEDLNFSQKATIKDISSSTRLYLTYTSPAAKFYISSSSPSFTYRAIDGACVPSGSAVVGAEVNITVTNGSKDYYIKVDTVNGSVSQSRNQ